MIRKKEKDFKISNKISLCCKAKMKLDYPNSDIGVCTKCNRIAIDVKKEERLSFNRNQSFKKIADDGLYNLTWKKKANNYRNVKHIPRSSQ
tara:strand:- start:12 stop:284 length:273 start_codon:yes stop_codon:yes gene_type:complete